jgi:hypothetical protein
VAGGAGVLAVVLLAVGAWWWLSSRPVVTHEVSAPAQPGPVPGPATGPTAAQPSVEPPAVPAPAKTAPVGAGTLVVDAAPWARVTVADRNGQPQALPSVFTPLSVALPAGDYTVTLQADGAAPVSEKVTVAPGQPRIVFRELRGTDPASYFRRLGFGARQ